MNSRSIKLFLFGFVIVIAAGMILFNMLDKNSADNKKGEENKVTLIDVIKENPGEVIPKDSTEIINYNKFMVNSDIFKVLVKIGSAGYNSLDGHEFDDEQMLMFASSYALLEEKTSLLANAKTIVQEKPANIKIAYLNGITKKIFGRELNLEKLTDYKVDGEYIEVSLPTSAPTTLYKFKEIRYNEKSRVYSIYFDEIKSDAVAYDEIKDIDKLTYNNDTIEATYRILYKETEDRNVFLGIHRIL